MKKHGGLSISRCNYKGSALSSVIVGLARVELTISYKVVHLSQMGEGYLLQTAVMTDSGSVVS